MGQVELHCRITDSSRSFTHQQYLPLFPVLCLNPPKPTFEDAPQTKGIIMTSPREPASPSVTPPTKPMSTKIPRYCPDYSQMPLCPWTGAGKSRWNIILTFTGRQWLVSSHQTKKKDCNRIHSVATTGYGQSVQYRWIKIYTPKPPANQKPRNKIPLCNNGTFLVREVPVHLAKLYLVLWTKHCCSTTGCYSVKIL